MARNRNLTKSATRRIKAWSKRRAVNHVEMRQGMRGTEWKARLVLAGIFAFAGLAAAVAGLNPVLAVALTVAPVFTMLPHPFAREWGTETLAVAFRLLVNLPAGRIPGTPGGRTWLLAELGPGKPAHPGEVPDETTRFTPLVRVDTAISALVAATVALLTVGAAGLSVSALLAFTTVFFYGQTASLVWRRGAYKRDALGNPAPDLWRVAPCYDRDTAVGVLANPAGVIVPALLVLGGAEFVAFRTGSLAVAAAAVPAAAAVAAARFLKGYYPLFAADRLAQAAEAADWAATWSGLLGTRVPAPAWAGAALLPALNPAAEEPVVQTHRVIRFIIPAGGSLETYEKKLPELRAKVGQELVSIIPSPQMDPLGRPMAGTVDPTSFSVVYPLEAPHNDKPYLDPAISNDSRSYYLTAIFHGLFAAAKLGKPRMTRLRRIGGGTLEAPRGRRVPPGQAGRGPRPGAVPRRPSRPAGVLLETSWEFPQDALISPTQLVSLTDKLKTALRVPYLSVGQRTNAMGELENELVIVVGCHPDDANVTSEKDRLMLEGLTWDTTFRAIGLTVGGGNSGLAPRLEEVAKTPMGLQQLTFTLPSGLSVEQIRGQQPKLKDAMRAGYLELPNVGSSGKVVVVTGAEDPLGRPLTDPWPWRNVEPGSLAPTDAVPFGIDDSGEVIAAPLFEKHWLVAGMTGGGKSVTAQQLLCGAALMRNTRMIMLDPKRVEIATWVQSGRVASYAYTDIDEATAVLEELLEEMRRRYTHMESLGLRKLLPSEEFPMVVLYIDELAGYSSQGKASNEFNLALKTLIAQARAAGITIIAATQKPSAELLPTSIRDNFSQKLALRCATSAHSTTILGDEWAPLGINAAKIPAGKPGLGYIVGDARPEGGRFRSFYLSDDDIEDVAARAAAVLGKGPGTGEQQPSAPTMPAIPGHITFSDDN